MAKTCALWEISVGIGRLDWEMGQFGPLGRGVGQGCLFGVYRGMVLGCIGDLDVDSPGCADGTVLISESERGLQDINKVAEEGVKGGLGLNMGETECVVTTKGSEMPVCHPNGRAEDVRQVNAIRYLGSAPAANGVCLPEWKSKFYLSGMRSVP